MMIKLKVNSASWWGALFIFFAFSSFLLWYYFPEESYTLVLTVSFIVSLVSLGAIMGILFYSQKEITMSDQEVFTCGFSSASTTIAFQDIDRIKVGSGGFSLYDKANNYINVTTLYSGFDEAKKLLNQKIKDHNIPIEGYNFFIRKYINS